MVREQMTSTAVMDDISLESKFHDETVEFSAVKEENIEDFSVESDHRTEEMSEDTGRTIRGW